MKLQTRTTPVIQKNSNTTFVVHPSNTLGRMCNCGRPLAAGGECAECRRKRLSLQRRAFNQHRMETAPTTRAFMGSRFNHDFGRMRVYTDNSMRMQTKLTINHPGDKYEQEADRVADQVMRTPISHHAQHNGESRGTPSSSSEYANSRKKHLGLQRRSLDTVGLETAPPIVNEVLRSPGRPLNAETRAFMEPRFGYDFSHVRVHSDKKAVESARAVNAYAYTVKQNIVFGAGQYAPETMSGKKLLAHELTHVVQQGSKEPSSLTNNIRMKEMGSSVVTPITTGTLHESQIQRQCDSEFPCLRTPFPPGQVRFHGCTDEQLGDYAVMPETGTVTTTPTNDTWIDTDGFWFRHSTSPTEWFKIPSHCDVEIFCRDSDFTCSKCCNLAASLFKGNPRWESGPHDTSNPFAIS